MCGIAGIVSRKEIAETTIRAMANTLRHRGPDDDGTVVLPTTNKGWNTALGHRRLSILDLSPAGHQPMSLSDGSLWITFNGEIYNYPELREELIGLGCAFRSHCDTEVLLHAWRTWGPAMLTRFNGMFAFGLWESATSTLFLARDRFGKKPLHYRLTNDGVSFASELKAFAALPDYTPEISPVSVSDYLAFEYIPAPRTILKGVNKLPSGCFLLYRDGFATQREWWTIRFPERPATDISHAEDVVIDRLREAIRRRMLSDVPLGVFLSGGIDSGAIVSLMSELIPAKQIQTFSIGFRESSFDESEHARHVANVFGTNHREQILDATTMLRILPDVLGKLDEPFADASILPTYLLSRFTREHVTVALGGDGGDELFAGYDPFLAHFWADLYEKLPFSLHERIVKPLAGLLPVSTANMSLDFKVKHFLKGTYLPLPIRNQVWLGAFSTDEQDGVFTSAYRESLGGHDPYAAMVAEARAHSFRDRLDEVAFLYQRYYLSDDILFKVDRASMMVSLEARTPFLDVELAEYTNALPSSWKMRATVRKYLLKKALTGRLPHSILYRRKKGFGIPLAQWFKNEMRQELTTTLSPKRLSERGIFRPEAVTRLIDEHLRGVADHRKPLWALYVFEKVRERWEGPCAS
jgi:asparagine synthase (glutamine-hydrolysing)